MSSGKWLSGWLLALALGCWHQLALAEPRLRAQQWSVEQGLSQASVNAALQDRAGFMWIGTHDGLNRFDGYAFAIYRADQFNPESLTHSYITALAEAPDGRLWVGTLRGLNALNPRTGRVQRLPMDDARILALHFDQQGRLWVGTAQGLARVDPATLAVTDLRLADASRSPPQGAGPIRALASDGAQGLWAGTEQGLARFDFATEQLTRLTAPGLPAGRLWFIHPMPDGALWLGHDAGIARFDQAANRASPLAVTDSRTGKPAPDWLRSARCSIADGRGWAWIGTEDNGVVCLEPQTGRAWRFVHQPSDSSSISDNAVRALCRDRADGLWLGTASGLCRYDPGAPVFTAYRHELGNPNSLGYDAVSSCFEDRQGRLWIGLDGGGLDCFDSQAGVFAHFATRSPPPYRLAGDRVWRIAEDHQGRLWFGGGVGGLGRRDPQTGRLRFYRPNPRRPRSFSSEVIYALLVDRDGVLWIGTERCGLARYDAATDDFTHFRHDPTDARSIPSDTVSRLIEDGDGRLWIGTSRGVARLDRGTGQVQAFPLDLSPAGGAEEFGVTSLFRDGAGGIWVGTRFGLYGFDAHAEAFQAFRPGPGKAFVGRIVNDVAESPAGVIWAGTEDGLNRIERATGRVTPFTTRQGLPANRIARLYADASGKLWLGLNVGLCRFDPETGRCQLFDTRDGLADNQARQSFFQRRNGEVLFISAKGFTAFRPEAVHPNPAPPPVAITGFQKFDRPIPFDGETLPPLDYNENFFAFEFAALNYTIPERNQYAYKLEGFDRDWVYCGTRRYASYTNLDPGEYVFRARGSNNSGVWNEEGAQVRIRIRPAPWRTQWAYAGYGLSLAGVVWALLRFRAARARARARLREAQFRAQAAESQAKVAAALATVRERDAEIFRLRNVELAEASQLVTDSLLYAQRIQAAILPAPSALPAAFGELFFIYRPKAIVSGDFYWFRQAAESWFLAVGDCTGHGVPGALMTMVGATLLDQMVIERGLSSPAAILTELDIAVRQLLRQDAAGADTQDGMDLALCRFDLRRGGVMFAGARQPLYLVRADGALSECRGSRRAIGGRQGKRAQAFEETYLAVDGAASLYLVTDGLADQPNGQRQKVGIARLRAWLREAAGLPFAAQGAWLAAALDAHMGEEPQRDDITLVGARFGSRGRSCPGAFSTASQPASRPSAAPAPNDCESGLGQPAAPKRDTATP